MDQPVIVSPPSYDLIGGAQGLIQRAVDFYPTLVVWLKEAAGILAAISIPVSLLLFIAILYCVRRLKQIRRKEADAFDLKVEPAIEAVPSGDAKLAHRWQSVTKHMEGSNPNDWKQAIIEADIMLDDILTKMGYRGDSVGEKLKRVEKGDFASVEDAWEAHKVRNAIAHEPGFSLTEHAAKHTIHLYKKVFEEFYYI